MSSRKSLREMISEKRKVGNQPKTNVEIYDPYKLMSDFKNTLSKKTAFVEQESPKHFCLWDENYPEDPGRVFQIKQRLEALHLLDRCIHIENEEISEEYILKKHTEKLYEKLKKTSTLSEEELRKESSKYDAVYFSQDTFNDAKVAASAAINLTLSVARGDFKNGFALIRPPGHHAMEDSFCGYCLFNNVAIAAEAALSNGLAKRILIVDYDVHHGQGTQQLFYERNDVLYFSIHRFENGLFWPNLRESDSDFIGKGKGAGFNVNIPLNVTGLEDKDYLAIVLNVLLPLAYEFKPDLILISAGYDAAIGCPEGEMMISPHFYGHLISLLSGLANGKIVVCLEGGYFKPSLAEGVACTIKALLGDACYPLELSQQESIHPSVESVINNVKFFLRNFWQCFATEEFFEFPKSDDDPKARFEHNPDTEHVTFTKFLYQGSDCDVYDTSDCYPIHNEDLLNKFTNIVKTYQSKYATSRTYENYVGYVYSEELLKHDADLDMGKFAPERPQRLTEIVQHFKEYYIMDRLKKVQEMEIDEKFYLKKIHDAQYLKTVLSPEEKPTQKPDLFHNEFTTICILKCISCILSLANEICDGKVKSGIAIIRPPGHHAAFDVGSGFCFVNNVVAAAEYVISKKDMKRVLIVDFDIHHGNGTQNLTYDRSDILYISLHRYDQGRFFPKSTDANFDKTGEGHNVNIPFNDGSKSNFDYWKVWYKIVLPVAYAFNPDFVIISAGFDAGIFDPLGGGYEVTPEMFGHFVATLRNLASGRMLLALEGGYHLKTTALSMTACAKALLNDPLPMPNFDKSPQKNTLETIKNVVECHKKYWPFLKVNKMIANFVYNNELLREH